MGLPSHTRSPAPGTVVRIELLGRFRVAVGSRVLGEDIWPGRRSAELVQLLALAAGFRLLADQVIETLWPHLNPAAAAANLRKAAHYARRTLGDPQTIVLRQGWAELFPSPASVTTDALEFEEAAAAVLQAADPAGCAEVAATYGGDLLPLALYEEWTQGPRHRLHSRYLALLQASGQWERLAELEPTDEPACRELMRAALLAGKPGEAIRRFGRLRAALLSELGVRPSQETRHLYRDCAAGLEVERPALVGRDLELARVAAVMRADAAIEVSLIAVRGPAGIGKSAVCQRIASMARAEGWRVVSADVDRVAVPYAPLATIVEQMVGTDRALLGVIGDRSRSVLAELTPLAEPAESLEGALTRHQVIGAVRRLVQASGAIGTLLVLDDAHAADEASLDAVFHLASRGCQPVVVVLAYRPDEAKSSLVRGVGRLARSLRALELDLGPLPRDEAAALVTASLSASAVHDPTAVTRIVELAEGNPFFLLELARGAATDHFGSTVFDAITARFVDIEEPVVTVLRRLAMAGGELEPATVALLAGLSEKDTFRVLDTALAAGVLVVSGDGYQFRHELVRQALAAQLAPHERVAVHRDAARRLAESHAPAAVIARHWLAGKRPTDAVPWLLEAARTAIRLGAFADALGHLGSLLELVPNHVDALCLRAEALDALGNGAAPAAFAAAAVVAGGPASHDIRAKQALAQLKLGDPPGALRTAAGLQPTTFAGKLAYALTLSGASAIGFGDPQVGAARAAECRRAALSTGDQAAVVVASWAHAAAAHARGELQASLLADLRETAALPTLAVSIFDGQLCITQRLLYGARPYSDVIAFADHLAGEARRLGAARGHAFAVTLRGEAELLTGDLVAAERDLVAGTELHRAIHGPTGESLSLQRRAELALYRGDLQTATELLQEALAIARLSDVGFHLFDRIYGTRIATAQRPVAGLALLEEAEDAIRGPVETCPGCRITFAVPAAIAAARAGDLERARRYAEATEMLATVVMRLPAWYAWLEVVRGHLALASAQRDKAGRHFSLAASRFRVAGQPLDAALAGSFGAPTGSAIG